MEIQIRVLAIFMLFCPLVSYTQGIYEDTTVTHYENKKQKPTDYLIVNLHPDSLTEFCPFDYHYHQKALDLFTDKEYLTAKPNHPVIRIAQNFDLSPFLRYLNTGDKIYILDVLRKLLLLCDEQNQNPIIIQLQSRPYSLAINGDGAFFLGCSNRSYIYKYQGINLVDSFRTIGNGIRNLLIPQNADRLFFTVRNAKSICSISLTDFNAPVVFNRTNNEYVKLIGNRTEFVYAIQSKPYALGKYSAIDLTLLETFQLQAQPLSVLKKDSRFFIQLDSAEIVLNDSIFSTETYEKTRLDSNGRYTWIVGSYTRAKWALNKKKKLEQEGLKCYLSNTKEGYYRLCAGLFKNQEDAVNLKSKHEELLDGAWLMTIHPHKF